jgi:hypothetical protein
MIRYTPLLTATCCALMAQPALSDHPAPKADLTPGTYLMVTRTYESDTNTLSEGAPKGEGEACFQVIEHVADGVRLAHLTGPYHPWWSDQPIQPGSTDTWFTSDAWRNHHPGAGKLDELHVIFSNVPACKAPQT